MKKQLSLLNFKIFSNIKFYQIMPCIVNSLMISMNSISRLSSILCLISTANAYKKQNRPKNDPRNVRKIHDLVARTMLTMPISVVILIMWFLNFVFRNYKREAELARMSWKIKPEDLLPTHLGARGQFGSRYSLGRLSLPVMKKDVSKITLWKFKTFSFAFYC